MFRAIRYEDGATALGLTRRCQRRATLAWIGLVFAAVTMSSRAADEIRPAIAGDAAAGYRLVWHDEFDGGSVDTNRWHFRTGARLLSFQKADNVTVTGGLMRLTLKKEEAGGLHYTAGGLISRQTFTYGYYEARFRCPKGAGWHTSFWTMYYAPPQIPGQDFAAAVERGKADGPRKQEIDICEQDSVNNRSYSAGVIDWSGQHGKRSEGYGRQYFRDTVPNFAADFHIWGCEFTPERVTFYLDGKPTHHVDATKFPHGEQNVWLTSVGALWGNPKKAERMDDAALPATADFDWIRVYTKP